MLEGGCVVRAIQPPGATWPRFAQLDSLLISGGPGTGIAGPLKGHDRGLFEYGLMLMQGEGGQKGRRQDADISSVLRRWGRLRL
jgi:hypothetical protein